MAEAKYVWRDFLKGDEPEEVRRLDAEIAAATANAEAFSLSVKAAREQRQAIRMRAIQRALRAHRATQRAIRARAG